MTRLYNAAPLPLGPRLVGQTISLGGTSQEQQQQQQQQQLHTPFRKRQHQQQQQSAATSSNLSQVTLNVKRLIGEGGFSFVYLVTDEGSSSSSFAEDGHDGSGGPSHHGPQASSAAGDPGAANSSNVAGGPPQPNPPFHLHRRSSFGGGIDQSITDSGASTSSSKNRDAAMNNKRHFVLKITTVQNREMRDIADKEAMLLRNLSHPSILKLVDDCYRGILTPVKEKNESSGQNRFNNMLSNFKGQHLHKDKDKDKDKDKEGGGDDNDNHQGAGVSNGAPPQHHQTQTHQTASSLQHMMLLEYCNEGQLLSTIMNMASGKQPRYTLPKLIIAFGQICNAVCYLHAQRPAIVHRDLKLENFLVCQGGDCLKLCDFGSAGMYISWLVANHCHYISGDWFGSECAGKSMVNFKLFSQYPGGCVSPFFYSDLTSTVFGRVPLRTQKERSAADDVIQKTTTQMYRAPEMVDLYMKPYLTEA
jgi:serine/threonine protein kinase